MDLKDIEEWGRELLQSEARKRGVRNPEVYSRTELMRLILQGYGAPTNVREAARLVGGILGSAKSALKERLGGGSSRRLHDGGETPKREEPYADWSRARENDGVVDSDAYGRYGTASFEADDDDDEFGDASERRSDVERAHLDAERDILREEARVREASRTARRDSERVRADQRAENAQRDSSERERPEPGWHRVRVERARVPQELESPWDQDRDSHVSFVSTPAAQREPQRGGDRDSQVSDLRVSAAERAFEEEDPPTEEIPMQPEAAARSDAQLSELSPTQIIAPTANQQEKPASVNGKSGVRRAPSENEIRAAREDREAASAPVPVAVPVAPEPPPEGMTYGPHPHDGMLLRWRVSAEAIERARKVLGAEGELAVRVVAVRIGPHSTVKRDVIDHGPVREMGDWTAPLAPTEARYVSAIGVRTGTRFVSIAHASG